MAKVTKCKECKRAVSKKARCGSCHEFLLIKRSKAYSRTKGHSFEREMANEFRDLGFKEARRQLEYHVMDANGVDLQKVEPFAVQLKKYKGYVPINVIEEIKPKTDFQIPLLITAADGKEPMAVISWENLKMMIRVYMSEK